MTAEVLKFPEPRTIVEQTYLPHIGKKVLLPFFLVPVSAGFPSPADEYIEGQIDLNDDLIKNPSATFLVRVKGDSMKNANIMSGDKLIVDRSLEARDGNIIIAVLDGELTVKRLRIKGERRFLQPENEFYDPIEITEYMEVAVWGVVTNVIHPTL